MSCSLNESSLTRLRHKLQPCRHVTRPVTARHVTRTGAARVTAGVTWEGLGAGSHAGRPAAEGLGTGSGLSLGQSLSGLMWSSWSSREVRSSTVSASSWFSSAVTADRVAVRSRWARSTSSRDSRLHELSGKPGQRVSAEASGTVIAL